MFLLLFNCLVDRLATVYVVTRLAKITGGQRNTVCRFGRITAFGKIVRESATYHLNQYTVSCLRGVQIEMSYDEKAIAQ